jgi:Uma2 family endonuclease
MEKIFKDIVYPDSDGKPMGDNTIQIKWMWRLYEGLYDQYGDDPNTLVCCNLLWYPVEGNNRLRVAPDVMVVRGRPNCDRGSYRQWEEGGVAPTVTFEILSPGNRPGEIRRKFRFFQRYGVQEYYLYDPSSFELQGWERQGRRLVPIVIIDGWVSPSLGIRFDLSEGELRIFSSNGREFLTKDQARKERERLAAKLRELGVDPDTITGGK